MLVTFSAVRCISHGGVIDHDVLDILYATVFSNKRCSECASGQCSAVSGRDVFGIPLKGEKTFQHWWNYMTLSSFSTCRAGLCLHHIFCGMF